MQTTRILIVEDEALIAEELRDRLEQLGHTVLGVVDTTDDAIAAARQQAPGLILMDVRLRGEGDGIDAAMLIVERADVPIVFMTAHSDAETIARAMLTRPYGYVVKPVREADLITAIQTALLRRASEEQLRASESQTRAIIENTADHIIQLLPDGRVLSLNSACRSALGYTPSQISQLEIAHIVAECDRTALNQAIWRAAEGQVEAEFLLTLVAKDGRSLPVSGVVGRQLGGRLDRLWAVFHTVGVSARPHGADRNRAAHGDRANGRVSETDPSGFPVAGSPS
jgi:PAS domain S-box-containing protein